MQALEPGSCPAGCCQPQAAAGAVRRDCPASSLSASTTHPDRLCVAALGMVEETNRTGSPCCSRAMLFHTAGPTEHGVYGAILSPAALRAGAREADEQLGMHRYFPDTLAASGIAIPLVAAVDTLTVSVLVGPGCQSERCSSSKSCA